MTGRHRSLAAREGHEAVVNLLLLTKGGANPDSEHKHGRTPLPFVVESGSMAVEPAVYAPALSGNGERAMPIRSAKGAVALEATAPDKGEEALKAAELLEEDEIEH